MKHASIKSFYNSEMQQMNINYSLYNTYSEHQNTEIYSISELRVELVLHEHLECVVPNK